MSTTYPTTPTPTPTKPKKRWPYIAAIPVALFIGIGLGSASHPATTTTTAAPVTVTAPAPANPYPMPSDARDNPPVPDPATAQAQPTGPLTTFSDGTYEVGTGDGQVAPGKYKSTPAADRPGYYARLKNNDGAMDDIIDNELSEGQMLLTVKKTDGYVEVSGTTFTKM